MRRIIDLIIISSIVCIIVPETLFGDSIDEEVLVLFKTEIIKIPNERTVALLKEIKTKPHVMSVLQNIKVIGVSKGFPDFVAEDTMRTNADGWSAKLPNFSNLYVLRLKSNTNRESAMRQLEDLPEFIYAEKN